jgi:hypothetical protein
VTPLGFSRLGRFTEARRFRDGGRVEKRSVFRGLTGFTGDREEKKRIKLKSSLHPIKHKIKVM